MLTRIAEALSIKTTTARLAVLATSKATTVREAVASHPNTSSTVLAELANDFDDIVKQAAARNKNTPAASLAKIYKYRRGLENTKFFLDLASNPSTPHEVLSSLVDHNIIPVCIVIASKETTPIDLLVKLAGSWAPNCRATAEANPTYKQAFNS